MPGATVLIPTFDHGPLVRHALASAQAQTVRDIEIFVVGDGAPPLTREIVERMAAADPRIRYFDNPKGERHGERHRHRALAEATGRIVCYLSDDDLWFPDHVATMIELLGAADFAGSARGLFYPDGRIYAQPCDLSLKQYRNPKIALGNRMGLSTGAHTLAIYRRLPEGWRPAPPDVFTDQHMWRQILAMPGCRAISGYRPTGVGFSSLLRRQTPLEEREREMARWAAVIADPAGLRGLREEILVANLGMAMWDAHFYAERRDWRGVWRAIQSQPTLRRLVRRLRGKPAIPPTA
jgi:glycosyltransferase involved in cell wall biosynthesis